MHCLRFVDEVHRGRQISHVIGSPEQEEARGIVGIQSQPDHLQCNQLVQPLLPGILRQLQSVAISRGTSYRLTDQPSNRAQKQEVLHGNLTVVLSLGGGIEGQRRG
jgi:hypothetical protein